MERHASSSLTCSAMVQALDEGPAMAAKQRRGTLVLSTLVSGAFLRVGSAYAIDVAHRFDIPAESLSQALADFRRTADRQVIFTEGAVKGRRTQGLRGSYTAAEALDALLAGTDLRVDVGSSGVLTIRARTLIDAQETTPYQRISYQPADQPAPGSTSSATAATTTGEPGNADPLATVVVTGSTSQRTL